MLLSSSISQNLWRLLSQMKELKDNYFICPKCRKIPYIKIHSDSSVEISCKCFTIDKSFANPKTDDISLDELTKYKKFNISLARFLSLYQSQVDQPNFIPHCSSSSKHLTKQTAKAYCIEDDKWFCEKCLEQHKNENDNNKHNFLETSINVVLNSKCEIKGCTSVSKYYCETCRLHLCEDCKHGELERKNENGIGKIFGEKKGIGKLFTMFKTEDEYVPHKLVLLSDIITPEKFKNIYDKTIKLSHRIDNESKHFEECLKEFSYKLKVCQDILAKKKENDSNLISFLKQLLNAYYFTRKVPDYNVSHNLQCLDSISKIHSEGTNQLQDEIQSLKFLLEGIKHPYFKADYDITTTSYPTKIFGDDYNGLDDNNCLMIIDGKQTSFTKEYKFNSKGTHSVKIIMKENLLKENHLITTMENMFFNCTSLSSIDFSYFNTQAVTSMAHCFHGCSSLNYINLSKINTESVKNMSHLFHGCSSLDYLDVSKFDTSSVKDMSGMFYDCSSIVSLDLSKFSTGLVVNIEDMFSGCSSIVTLDLSSFSTVYCKDMSGLFNGCINLTSVNIISFDTSNVYDMGHMFSNCSSLPSLDLSNFNMKNVEDISFMFESCEKLYSLDLPITPTTDVKTMENMFYNCSSLNILDLSGFELPKVTTLKSMFQGCSSLTYIKMPKLNCKHVTCLSHMFDGCKSMVNIDLSGMNTENVTHMNHMFSNCSSLKVVNIATLTTEKVIYMQYMFNGCSSIPSLCLSNFTTTNTKKMNYMFAEMSSLTDLDVSSFTSNNLNDVECMFYNCSSLSNLELGDLEKDINNIKKNGCVFFGCGKLKEEIKTKFPHK